jgi:integrase/plasmid maintenance system antidote protein VapI
MATATSLIALPARSHVAPLNLIDARRVDDAAAGITVGQLCRRFLQAKYRAVRADELTMRSLFRYSKICRVVATVFGFDRAVASLRPDDFCELREVFARTHRAKSLAVDVACVKAIFNHAADYLDRPVRFGSFKKPPARTMRLARAARGAADFSAAEIRALIDYASPMMAAILLLGINCGLGNTDCGQLRLDNLDLAAGWLDYPRRKTGIGRRVPLWPETVLAIRRIIVGRNIDGAELLFSTRCGRALADGWKASALITAFRKLKKKAGINRRGIGFYSLRHSFATAGSDSGDEVALSSILGHVDPTMGGVYRERISDDRLHNVVDTVRAWLFPIADKNRFSGCLKLSTAAKTIRDEWGNLEQLKAADVRGAIERLEVSQRELAKGVGLHAGYVHRVVIGRQKLGGDFEERCRHYIGQLADGLPPTPLARNQLRPAYDRPADVPLDDASATALRNHPFTATDLAAVIASLAELGVTQARLAVWWGFKPRHYEKLRAGERRITLAAANRLRTLFGVAPIADLLPPAPSRELGRLIPTPRAREFLQNGTLDHDTLRAILAELKEHYRIRAIDVSKWLGYERSHITDILTSGKPIKFAVRLRGLFADDAASTEGGAQ